MHNFFAFVVQCYKFPMCCTAHFHELYNNATSNMAHNIPLTIKVLLTLAGGEMHCAHKIYVNYTGKVRHAYTIFMCTGTKKCTTFLPLLFSAISFLCVALYISMYCSIMQQVISYLTFL